MTDKKVIQLAQEMINFFTEICHFESKERKRKERKSKSHSS